MKGRYLDNKSFVTDGDWRETYSAGRKIRVIWSDTLKKIFHVVGSIYNEKENLTYVKVDGVQGLLAPDFLDIELAAVSNRSLPIHSDVPYRENYFWNVLQNSPYKNCIFDLFTTKDDPMIIHRDYNSVGQDTNPEYDELSRQYIFTQHYHYLEVELVKDSNEYKLGVSLAVLAEKDSEFDFYYNCGHGDVKINLEDYYPQFFKNIKLIIKPKSEVVLPVSIAAIGILHGIYKNQTYESVVEPDAELKIDREQYAVTQALAVGTVIKTPMYIVSSGQLTVYLNGTLLTPVIDYLELGEPREESTYIKLVKALNTGELTFLVHRSKSLFNTDSPLYYLPRWFDNLAENYYKLSDRITKLELEHNMEVRTEDTCLTPQGKVIAPGIKMAPVIIVDEGDHIPPRNSALVFRKEVFEDGKG